MPCLRVVLSRSHHRRYSSTFLTTCPHPLCRSIRVSSSFITRPPGIGRAVPVTNGNLPLQDSSGHLGCGRQTFTGTYVNGNTGPRFGVDTPCAVAFGTTASSINTEYFVSGRLDYNINDKQKIYFRISRDAGTQASFTSPISPVYNRQSVQPWVIPQLNYTYAITPNLVNNFILNGNWYSAITGPANFNLAQSDLPTAFGFADGGANGSNTTNGGPTSSTGTNSSTGFAGIGPSLPVGRRGQQLGIIDDLSWSVKHHTLQAGVNDRNNRISDSSIASGSVVGTYNFNDLTDFTVGIVNSTSKAAPIRSHFHCFKPFTLVSTRSAFMCRMSGRYAET